MTNTTISTPLTEVLAPQKLLETLAIARIDYINLAGADEEPEVVALLDRALSITANSLGLPGAALEKHKDDIASELEAMRREIETGEPTAGTVPREKILQSTGPDDIFRTIWSLFDATARTADPGDREHLLKTTRFLWDYWNAEEWIAE